MTLYYEEDGDVCLGLDCEALGNLVAEASLAYIGCPYETELNMLLTEDEEIRKMNREFRDIDRATDVLSFPAAEFPRPGDFAGAGEQAGSFDPDTGEFLLGDIVISKERVRAQAEEYGHSVRREFAFLVAHSVLHLCGHDHMEEEERLQMERLQEEILKELDITR